MSEPAADPEPRPRPAARTSLLALLEPLRRPFKAHRRLLALTIIAGWGKFLIPLALPHYTQLVLDRVLAPAAVAARGIAATDRDLLRYGAICLGAVLVSGVAAYYRSALTQRMAARIQHGLRRRLFSHLQRLSMAFFQTQHSGALGARVSSDINQAGALIDKGLVQYAMDGLALVVVLTMMFTTHVGLSVATLAMLLVTALVLRHFTPRIRRGQKLVQEGHSGITGQAAEIFAGISLVKAYAGERESVEVFQQRSEHVLGLQWENSGLQGWFNGLSHTCIQATVWTVLFVGGWFALHHPSGLSHGELVKFLMLVGILTGTVQRMIDVMLVVQDGFASLERINELLAVLPTPADAADASTPPLAGTIEFRDVTFAYRDQPVVRDFSFTFRQGRSYALVGPSGSGKSSLCQLMLRFYDPQQGAIRIDGHELRGIQQQHYRQSVSVVLQDPILFSTSVYDNIDFGVEGATRDDVVRAAISAQAHDFIMALPKGYDTRLGERGVSLSGGQRQRLAIARALMRRPKVLILDEATSALDSVTERSIQEVVDRLHGSCTIIVIAHRLSTVRNVDEVVVLDHGRIAEHGGYDDLIRSGGLFAKLVAQQERDD